jgi:hypothetical protein
MSRAVDDAGLDDSQVLEVTEAAQTGVRRHRRRLGMSAAAVAAVTAAALTFGGGTAAPSPSPVPDLPTPGPASGFEWAKSLPYRETALAFTFGGRLFTPAGELDFGTDRVRLVATADDHWLVDTGRALTLVGPDGSIRHVVDASPNRAGAFSPDGDQLAYGAGVIDVAEPGRLVATLPGDVEQVTGWGARGVEYLGVGGRTWAWRPGGASVRVGELSTTRSERTDIPERWGSGADELVRDGDEVYAVFVGPGSSPGNRGTVVVRCWTHPPGGFVVGTACSRVSSVLLPVHGEEVVLGIQ